MAGLELVSGPYCGMAARVGWALGEGTGQRQGGQERSEKERTGDQRSLWVELCCWAYVATVRMPPNPHGDGCHTLVDLVSSSEGNP